MAQLNALGIVVSDMERTIRFYRIIGARRAGDTGEGHVETDPRERTD